MGSTGNGGPSGKARMAIVCIVLLCAAGWAIAPVSAGDRFITGSPNLSASILGANEFSPGQDATISVVIQNSGLIEYVFTYPTTITAADLPNTAKLMTVTLGSGEAPITIKSDPQMIGDLKGGATIPVSFRAKISSDAPADDYVLPLSITYTYLWSVDQYGQDVLQYFYKETGTTLMLPVHIKPEIVLGVISAEPVFVNVGTEGYLNLTLQNNGNEDGKEAVVRLTRNGNSPVQPVSSSVYIGDFPKGSIVPIQYRIAVSQDASALTYPVNVSVVYTNSEGDTVSTDPVTVGVPVGGKIGFSIASPETRVNPGSKQVILVDYRNTGSATVYGASARIIPVDPFTTTDDISYLGDMGPGDTRTARFDITVDPGATVKGYAFDSEIRYRDALDNDLISDRIKVPVEVVPVSGIMGILSNSYVIAIIIVVIVAVVALVVTRRRKGSA